MIVFVDKQFIYSAVYLSECQDSQSNSVHLAGENYDETYLLITFFSRNKQEFNDMKSDLENFNI